jgi:hypothetical protein
MNYVRLSDRVPTERATKVATHNPHCRSYWAIYYNLG